MAGVPSSIWLRMSTEMLPTGIAEWARFVQRSLSSSGACGNRDPVRHRGARAVSQTLESDCGLPRDRRGRAATVRMFEPLTQVGTENRGSQSTAQVGGPDVRVAAVALDRRGKRRRRGASGGVGLLIEHLVHERRQCVAALLHDLSQLSLRALVDQVEALCHGELNCLQAGVRLLQLRVVHVESCACSF